MFEYCEEEYHSLELVHVFLKIVWTQELQARSLARLENCLWTQELQVHKNSRSTVLHVLLLFSMDPCEHS